MADAKRSRFGPAPRSPAERFWPKVQKTETCWLWLGCKRASGYGQFFYEQRGKGQGSNMIPATHAVWRLTYGDVPKGMQVLHRCDNPACVNPSHLFLGTQKENLADMYAKKRQNLTGRLRGERHLRAKLTEDEVRDIRRSTSGRTVLAKKYGVTKATITCVLLRKSWAWLS